MANVKRQSTVRTARASSTITTRTTPGDSLPFYGPTTTISTLFQHSETVAAKGNEFNDANERSVITLKNSLAGFAVSTCILVVVIFGYIMYRIHQRFSLRRPRDTTQPQDAEHQITPFVAHTPTMQEVGNGPDEGDPFADARRVSKTSSLPSYRSQPT